jgi:hypothetical protein
MLKNALLFAIVTIVTHMTLTIYSGMKQEERYFNFITSGKFLTDNKN